MTAREAFSSVANASRRRRRLKETRTEWEVMHKARHYVWLFTFKCFIAKNQCGRPIFKELPKAGVNLKRGFYIWTLACIWGTRKT